MDRLATLMLCAVGCAAAPHSTTSPAIEEVTVAAYDAPLTVVLDAVRDVAITRFHRVAIIPRERAAWTDWQWTYGAPEESFLWRVDVSVSRERPWRITVKPHAASYEGEAAIEQRASGETEDPAWLQQYADAFLAQVHDRLRRFAVAMPALPRSSADLDASSPPLAGREIVDPPSEVVIERDTSNRRIDRYRINGMSQEVAFIEGATIDVSSRAAIGGVIVTAWIPGHLDVLQTVSDETGYYRFDDLKPGVYSISAYYSVSHRGQIEIRRSNITVEGGEISIVPLLVDTRQP
jgi:hypothetical protein